MRQSCCQASKTLVSFLGRKLVVVAKGSNNSLVKLLCWSLEQWIYSTDVSFRVDNVSICICYTHNSGVINRNRVGENSINLKYELAYLWGRMSLELWFQIYGHDWEYNIFRIFIYPYNEYPFDDLMEEKKFTKSNNR